MIEERARPPIAPLDRRDAAWALSLAALPMALYASTARQWWTGDDTQILKHALSHSLGAVFTDPSVWRELSWLYFTPLVTASTRLDAALFGLEPAAWYMRHLLVLGLTGALLYLLMRGSAGRTASVSAALLLLAGPPTAEISRQLWTRHYVEGLACALASLLLFRRAVGNRGLAAAFGAGLSGLAAMLGKEVFAAVPLIALTLPWGSMRQRSRAATPLLVALAVYLVWRNAMVGYWGGVGGGGEGLLEPVRRAGRQLASFPGVLLGMPAVAGLVLLGLALALIWPTRRDATVIVGVAVLVVAPLSMLRDPPAGRYAIVPLVALAALVGTAVDAGLNARGVRRACALLLAVGVPGSAAVSGHKAFAIGAPAALRSRAEALFYSRQSGRGDVLYQPVEPAWYFDGLDWLRARSSSQATGTVVYDSILLCDRLNPARLYAYDPAAGNVVPGLRGPLADIAATCARLDRTLPLSAALEYRDPLFTWRLGPDAGGSWTLLSGGTGAPFTVAREGSLIIHFRGDVSLRIRHEAPDSRLGLSPPLTLHVRGGAGSLSFSEP